MIKREVTIFGVRISRLEKAVAFSILRECLSRGEKTQVIFANSNLMMAIATGKLDPRLLHSFMVLNDGVALEVASRAFYAAPFPENLVGTDFVPEFLSCCPPETRVFLFGAKDGVAQRAGLALAEQCNITICGTHHGYSDNSGSLVTQIKAARADVVLVCLGNPLQELWIAEHALRSGACIVFGAGALLDFLAEEVPRAPIWIRRLKSEWAYRLAREPRRLWRRYIIEVAKFWYFSWREARGRWKPPSQQS